MNWTKIKRSFKKRLTKERPDLTTKQRQAKANILEASCKDSQLFYQRFFGSVLWKATDIKIADPKYMKLNRLDRMVYLRDAILRSEKGKKISAKRLTKKK